MSVINIDYRDRRPIYEQIVVNVKELIIKGILKPDDYLPSVRALSGELGINPNTIQKAYTELERQNIIRTLVGRGSIVCSDVNSLTDNQREELYSKINENVQRAKILEISHDELIAMVEKSWNGENTND